MSDNIPFEIQIEIIKRISDVKSLIQFRSVSKTWKSVIDAPEFIAGYRAHHTQPRRLLLVSSNVQNDQKQVKYISVDNDTLTQQQQLDPNVSSFIIHLNDVCVIGFSRGLVCLYACDNKGGILILWNPSIRRSVGIVAPTYSRTFGFAVCPVTNEPTIVQLSHPCWKVQIFTLSSKKWTEIQCRKPREFFTLIFSQVVIGSCIYRVACQSIRQDGSFTHHYIIVSFDLIAKEFRAIDLPDTIAKPFTLNAHLTISKLKGSLVVIAPHTGVKAWKMEPNCSFTQLFSINTSFVTNIVGFRKNGELVVETSDERTRGIISDEKGSALEVYDPSSHHINNLGFSGLGGEFFLSSYKETLLLLDHSNSCIYPDGAASAREISPYYYL